MMSNIVLLNLLYPYFDESFLKKMFSSSPVFIVPSRRRRLSTVQYFEYHSNMYSNTIIWIISVVRVLV